MIYTLTLNPSVDYIVSVDDFTLGKTNRTTHELKNPGGKGINVSRVLNNLNVKSKAFGFTGGFTGDFIKQSLQQEGIDTDFIELNGESRINVKLRTGVETEVNGQSPIIDDFHLAQLKEQLSCLKEGDVLVIGGSVPDCLPASIYYTLLKEVDGRGVKVVVDTSGEPLLESVKAKPFLIKPNHHELAEVFGYSEVSVPEAVTLGKKLIDQGVQHIIVSMAGEGALLITKEEVLFADVPNGEVKNSVGAGDSVVAGFIASYIQHSDIKEAFRYGIAAGSATAFSEGFCEKHRIEELKRDINLKEL